MELPKPPEETDLRNIIDKLAQFVARNGPEFEHMTKQKQKDNPKFSFLFGGEHFNYYQYRVTTEQAILKQKQRSEQQAIVQHSITQQSIQSAPWQQAQQQHCQIPIQPTQEVQDQIRQSEQNLAAQHQLLLQQQQVQIDEIIRKAQEEKLIKMAQGAEISLEELDKVSQPIIEQCTKDAISSGKGWIFNNSNTPQKIEVICEYLLKRVISPNANFDARLHLVYLINDVLHHCVRKNADDLKNVLNRVVVPIFCTTSLGVDEEKQQKLEKLLKLWETHNYFEPNVLDQLKNPSVTVAAFQASIITEHANYISQITTAIQAQYAMLQKQHQDYVAHLTGQMQQMHQNPFGYPQQMHQSMMGMPMAQQPLNQPNQTGMSSNFGIIQQQNQQATQQAKLGTLNTPQQGDQNSQPNQQGLFMQQNIQQSENQNMFGGGQQRNRNLAGNIQIGINNVKIENALQNQPMGIQGFANQTGQNNNFQGSGPNFQGNQFNQMNQNFTQGGPNPGANQSGNFNQGTGFTPLSQQQQFQGMPPSGPVHTSRFGDFYKPPQPQPAFIGGNNEMQSNQGPSANMGGPGGADGQIPFQQNQIPPEILRETVMPSVPYYDLPAGLMVPLVALEEHEYCPLDPDDIRLPPPAPPSERLLTAVEMFYAPPSHDRPRNSDGWEQLGLYEFFKAKSNCKKRRNKNTDDHLNSEGEDSRDTQESNTQDEPFGNSGSSPLLPTPSMAPNPMMYNQSSNYSNYEEQSPPRRRYRETKSPPQTTLSISSGGGNYKQNSPPTRRRVRSRSRSRSRTPPPYQRPNRSHSRSRSRSMSRERSHSRSRSRSMSRDRSRSRSRSRTRNYRRYSRSRSRSKDSRSRSKSRTPPRHRDDRERERDRSPTPPRFGYSSMTAEQRLDENNKGHQLLKKMGWSGMGLGAGEQGIQEPIHAGDVRDRQDQYKGVGVSLNDPYESFRKSKGQAFINRMKARAEELGKS